MLEHLFNALNEKSDLLNCKVERVLEAVSGFTNNFRSSFEDNELHFLSFGVPAKPGISKDLIGVDNFGRNAIADFIDLLLIENLSFTAFKLKTFEACKVKKKLSNLQNVISQRRA